MTGQAGQDRRATSRARAGTVRPLLLRLHFYAGVLVAPFVLVAAVTGGLYALSEPLERAVYGELLQVPAVVAPLPLAEQVAAAEGASDVRGLVGVRPAPGERGTTRVLFDDGTLEESALHAVFVHPGTAEVLGQERVYGTSGSLPQRTWIAQLHRSLHLGEPGRVYSELAASWLWVVALGGLVLWVGRRRRSRAAAGRARTRSRHAVLGVALLVGLLVLSATGLTWSRWAGANVTDLRSTLGWQAPAVSTALVAGAGEDAGEHVGHGGGPAGPAAADADPAATDRVLAAARSAGLTSDQVEVRLPSGPGTAWTVSEVHRAWPTQVDAVAVDPGSLAVVDEARFEDYPLMAKLARWGVDLHMGVLLGLPNQLALAALAAGLVVQVVLGYRMWWQRRPASSGLLAFGPPYRRGAWRSAPRAGLAALVAVAAVVGWFLPVLGASLLGFLVLDVLLGRRAARRRPGPPAADLPHQRGARTGRLVLTALAAATAGAAAAVLVGGTAGSPAEGSAEAGFARDMQVHHAQAVALASLALDRSTDAEVRALAVDVVQTQQAQIGMMAGWLQAWGLPRAGTEPQMAWTGHAHDGPMPGTATPEQVQALAAARGPAFDLLLVRLLHRHHAEGLPMAQAVLDRTDEPPVVELATSIRDSQRAELAVLDAIALRVSGGRSTASG